jgi:hypothetical protein
VRDDSLRRRSLSAAEKNEGRRRDIIDLKNENMVPLLEWFRVVVLAACFQLECPETI